MVTTLSLFSPEKGEINRFLSSFYETDLEIENELKWTKEYKNPVEMAEIVGTFADNIEDYNLNLWICLDNHVYINITNNNANEIIRYLYERFPY